ncbi:glycogen debranching enzyme [Coccinella septempunctata]|uniref:glycogen debranching enzyme n=1 Tax=Coccinella septempunctata TaxID=41139 RepID=UPI001D07D349|nr:glycogen debranching enzyme [Coccinella septempunctata]
MLYPMILLSTTAAVIALVFKKSIREALLCCYDWILGICRWCDNWEVGTYSSTSNLSLGSNTTIGICVREILPQSPPPECCVPPSSPASSVDEELPLSILTTVEEERSSQLSPESSQQAIGLAAESIADICGSTFSLNQTPTKSKLDKRKSGSSDSSLRSKKNSEGSREPTPSPSKSKQKKKADDVHLNIEEDQTSFTVVKDKKGGKNKSPEKLSTPASVSPAKVSPKQSQPIRVQPRASSPDIQSYQVKYTDKPSRVVDSGISYAQVASSSPPEPRVEIAVDAEAALLAIKEPEPTRPPLRRSQQDSSESNSEGPLIFQTETVVHRTDFTENKENTQEKAQEESESQPKDSESSIEVIQRSSFESSSFQEEPNEEIDKELNQGGSEKILTKEKLKEEKNISPDSTPEDCKEGTTSGDQFETEIEGTSVVEVVNPPTLTETPYSGEESQCEVGEVGLTSPDSTHDSLTSVESLSFNKKKACYQFVHARGNFPIVPNTEPSQNTIADVSSDILDNEAKDESDLESVLDPKSEDISSRSDNIASEDISGRSISIDVSESENSRSDIVDQQGVKVELQPCSSKSFSSSVEKDPALLGGRISDVSDRSLESAARIRRISDSTTEEQKSEKKESAVEDLGRTPVRSCSFENKSKKKSKKSKKSRGKKSKAEKEKQERAEGVEHSPGAAQLNPEEENQSLPVVSEVVEEEKVIIQEEAETENQAINIPKFLRIQEKDSSENIYSKTENLTEESLETKPEEIPFTVERNLVQEPSMEKLEEEQQIRVLKLGDPPRNQECFLYRLQKNWIIEFRLGPTLFGRKIDIFCNFPEDKDGKLKEFDSTTYQLLKWQQDGESQNSDDTASYARIVCRISGRFHYYFTDKNDEDHSVCGSGYFLVDPELTFGDNEHLPLNSIQCQTVISKQLGPFSSWESKLRVSKETGYNMVHFTPVQALGASNSAYCIKDQLEINPSFKENNDPLDWEDLRALIEKMRKEWKIMSICDVVLNHTANETPWIKEHVEATYNCQSCKYMRPAYLLDAALYIFEEDVRKGMYETRGIPPLISTEDHLNAMRYQLKETVLKELKLQELFICDVNKCVSEFMELARQNQPGKDAEENIQLELIQDADYRRLASSVNMDLAMKIYNIYRPDCFDEDTRLRRSCEEFKKKLDSLNQAVIDTVQDHLNAAVENVISGVRHWRVSSDGPKLGEINVQNPLIGRYFTDYGDPKNLKEYEDIMYSDDGSLLMAHNGWVIDSDPLVNFAMPESNVYIRRELIPWGDSVKLRYGEKPSDSPFLWDMMKKYVELTATIFQGVRLDNCHSTPLCVAEYMMDCARRVKPDLYVVAELFTNSGSKDNIFVNRLGITSLIREAMSAGNSHEHGRLIYLYGGNPVGSFYQPNVHSLTPTLAHALFFDQTHDNESPAVARSVFNFLPSAALVNMAGCGTGSNRGYDELVPHQISVVNETREYTEWNSENADNIPKYTSFKCGILEAKKALNDLHFRLGLNGFDEVYVDQMDPDIVAVTRHCPKTHQRYILVAFTAFGHPDSDSQRDIRPLVVEGVLDEIILEATMSHFELSNGGSKYARHNNFTKNNHYINGLSEYVLHMKQHVQLKDSEVFEETSSGSPNEIALKFKNFQPGSIVIIKVSLPRAVSEAVAEVRKLADQFSSTQETDFKRVIKKLELRDLNRVLYRCDQEERDEGKGFDTYDIPNHGKLVYAGLQGFISLLSEIRPMNNLGHPMCENIRQGDWMIDYIYQRLKLDEGTEELGTWIEKNTKSFKVLPKYLKPAYFDLIFTRIYDSLLEHSYNLMSSFVKKGSKFVKALSMGSIQFAAYISSANLPTLSPNLAPPKPPCRKGADGKETQVCASLSAGLPHFSVGYMRNWGRDTFIALRGLLLLTGRHQEARYHILAYAACLRHGLIPNLLDGGRKPRYNCRDAVWWWLYCIKCYTEEVPDGIKILEDKVSRIFPTDDSPPQQPGAMEQSLQDVMQEALNKHLQGLTFRERNAGREIDDQMKWNGFNNQIGVDPKTGFVFGGNVDNCGTWMDKMGSSEKAGIKGKPSTPRDGSACEIVGLSKCVVTWLGRLHAKGLYKYESAERKNSKGKPTRWTYHFWAFNIKENFEKHFWVNEEPTEGEENQDVINKRGIYKDCHGSAVQWTDYQLRCNFPIVMVVAPELFDPQHAWTALQKVEQYLLGPLGVKTLDPEDWSYRADYDNSNDSDDPTVAHGANYHQGPEWVWPIGYFLRAKLHFAAKNKKLKETIAETKYRLSRHFTELMTSEWRGLPELTNNNGAFCKDSSRTQAWSMACVLEVLHDLQKIESSIK